MKRFHLVRQPFHRLHSSQFSLHPFFFRGFANHAGKHQNQHSRRRHPVGRNDKRAQGEWQGEHRMRKPNQPQKSFNRAVRSQVTLKRPILKVCHRWEDSPSKSWRNRALVPERMGVPWAKRIRSTDNERSWLRERRIWFWFRQYFRGRQVKP